MKTSNSDIENGLKWLDNQTKRDELEIQSSKENYINEILSFDKEKMFEKKKLSLWDRIKLIFGYGRNK